MERDEGGMVMRVGSIASGVPNLVSMEAEMSTLIEQFLGVGIPEEYVCF